MLKIALDIATSMGVAYFTGQRVICTTYKGSPVEQLEMLLDVVGEDLVGVTVYIEQENNFRNANTTRNILHRVGYLKNSLEKFGASVVMINAMTARKHLGVKGKAEVKSLFAEQKLNSDEADAVAILLCGEGLDVEFIKDNITKMGD